eukprot:TRINITY_DN4209_c0_g1_i1.p1 TRINITY_DN4209_c0_g1~~TRINITY_DN4209_c0_g1_i1.p1  ORF type:complete len:277 (-),score=48.72 TRINITY_DN4209_c0_g1_i1:59-889(-)
MLRSPMLQAQQRRSPAVLVAVPMAVAAFVAAIAVAPWRAEEAAFVIGARPAQISRLADRSYLVCQAEDVVDVEVEDDDGDDDDEEEDESRSGPMPSADNVSSVFDGPKKDYFKQRYKGRRYKVFRSTWTYIRDDGQRGKWNRGWTMPQEAFEKNRGRLLKDYKRKARKLRQKCGMGQRYPNGKLVHLQILQGSPFTRELYGEKYIGRAEWVYHPDEKERRATCRRALELKRKLAMENEERRLARLKELGVWTGKPEWRENHFRIRDNYGDRQPMVR